MCLPMGSYAIMHEIEVVKPLERQFAQLVCKDTSVSCPRVSLLSRMLHLPLHSLFWSVRFIFSLTEQN